MAKIALITGGASGMGFAVAEGLSKRSDWKIHLLDLNLERGQQAAKTLGPNTSFHKVDVTSYKALASAFETIFQTDNRLDFVFANAGIVERSNFYAEHPKAGPPPEPDQLVIDICLKSVVNQSYLAQHYFRKSPGQSGSLIMTSSCGGLYPSPFSPMYSAAKHGVVGLMRSIAKHYYLRDGIRVDAICPGTVRTNLLTGEEWKQFPEEFFTPVEVIVETVLMLVDGVGMTDAKGNVRSEGEAWGRAVEINGRNFYFRVQPEWCDEKMRAVMAATDVDDGRVAGNFGNQNGTK